MSRLKIDRPKATDAEVEEAIKALVTRIADAFDDKGRGVFVSHHETLGSLEEERLELVAAIHDDETDEEGVEDELLDLAVSALFGYLSSRKLRGAT